MTRAWRISRIVMAITVLGSALTFAVLFFDRMGIVPIFPQYGPESNPLPAIEEIALMEASDFHDTTTHEFGIRFTVPRDHWEHIFAALLPARSDRHPMKWAGNGDLNLTLKNGKPFIVNLYHRNGDVG